MLVPYDLTSSGSHPAWKKVSLLYSPKRIQVRLNNKSFQLVTQFVTQMTNDSSCLFLKNHITLKVEDCCPWWS